MPEELRMIWLLAVALASACTAGFLAQKAKLSPILGYLLAGYLIGPHSPGIIVDQELSNQFANIGVTLLMFAVGLHLNWKDLTAVKKIVIPGGIILSFLSILAGVGLTVLVGESTTAGFVIGIAVCVSSTVVMARVLSDYKLLRTPQGYIVMGWTIVEDLISVFGLVLLPTLAYLSFHQDSSSFYVTLYAVGTVTIKILAFVIIIYVLGEKLISRVLKMIAKTQSQELFTLAILAAMFLIAVASSSLFGISLALGAFVAGKMIGDTDFNHHAASNALPMRDAFSVLFFISVGMLFDPLSLRHNIPFFLGILVILLLFRPLIAYGILKFKNYPSYVRFTAAAAITQIGEYSFILAQEGSRLNILPENSYDIIVACSFITIAINPLFFQIFARWMVPQKEEKGNIATPSHPFWDEIYNAKGAFLPRAIVIGYGPVGRAVTKELSQKKQVVVIDQNYDFLVGKKEVNVFRVYGDATKNDILEHAKVKDVEAVFITIPDVPITETIIALVRAVNPTAKIIARVHFHAELKKLKKLNVPIICDEEMAALEMKQLVKDLT